MNKEGAGIGPRGGINRKEIKLKLENIIESLIDSLT